jgi:hypothetical protein
MSKSRFSFHSSRIGQERSDKRGQTIGLDIRPYICRSIRPACRDFSRVLTCSTPSITVLSHHESGSKLPDCRDRRAGFQRWLTCMFRVQYLKASSDAVISWGFVAIIVVTQGWYYASISTLVVKDSVASLVSGAQYVRNTRRLLSIGRNREEEVHDITWVTTLPVLAPGSGNRDKICLVVWTRSTISTAQIFFDT